MLYPKDRDILFTVNMTFELTLYSAYLVLTHHRPATDYTSSPELNVILLDSPIKNIDKMSKELIRSLGFNSCEDVKEYIDKHGTIYI
jgi:hypothetical protein